MRRGSLLLALAALLAACSSSGERERTTSAMLGAVLSTFAGGGSGGGGGTRPGKTRAELDEIAGPLISLRRGESRRVFVPAVNVNRGEYVTYADNQRRSLTLRGGAVSATDNFGIDLEGIAIQTDDPIVHAAPVDSWPDDVTRAYKLHRRDAPIETLTFRCTLLQLGLAEIEIVERKYQTIEIAERCTNGQIVFENRHWADPATGFLWKSTQWIGPKLSPITYEVISPYTPG